jgi:hypothetical protein
VIGLNLPTLSLLGSAALVGALMLFSPKTAIKVMASMLFLFAVLLVGRFAIGLFDDTAFRVLIGLSLPTFGLLVLVASILRKNFRPADGNPSRPVRS